MTGLHRKEVISPLLQTTAHKRIIFFAISICSLVFLWFTTKMLHFDARRTLFVPANFAKYSENLPKNWSTDYVPLNGLNCTALFYDDAAEQKKAYKYTYNATLFEERLKNESFSCDVLQRMFPFFDAPLSKEEEGYPLAYGMIVHADITQILYLLTTIYQPQNQFCIAVDGKASDEFYGYVESISKCYPNIYVMRANSIIWGGYAILESVHNCLTYLTKLEQPWKYFQYLSGVDAPLKTNLEMVRIFKALNGSVNNEVLPYDAMLLQGADFRKSPLRLMRSSMSALYPREVADIFVNHPVAKELLAFLRVTNIADESFYSTMLGNPDQLKLPGGFDGNKFLLDNFPAITTVDGQIFDLHPQPYRWNRTYTLDHNSTFPKERYEFDNYYISRYQVWDRNGYICYGELIRYSCVYGVRDLPNLVRRPELIAHKMYTYKQPAAFFCLIHEHRRRSLNPVNFTGEEYRNLPRGPHSYQ